MDIVTYALAKKAVGDLNIDIQKQIHEAIENLIDEAPETLDTLKEIADALGDDPKIIQTLLEQLKGKVDKEDGKGLSQEDFTTELKDALNKLLKTQDNWMENNPDDRSYIKGRTHWNNSTVPPVEFREDLLEEYITITSTDKKVDNILYYYTGEFDIKKWASRTIRWERIECTIPITKNDREITYQNSGGDSVFFHFSNYYTLSPPDSYDPVFDFSASNSDSGMNPRWVIYIESSGPVSVTTLRLKGTIDQTNIDFIKPGLYIIKYRINDEKYILEQYMNYMFLIENSVALSGVHIPAPIKKARTDFYTNIYDYYIKYPKNLTHWNNTTTSIKREHTTGKKSFALDHFPNENDRLYVSYNSLKNYSFDFNYWKNRRIEHKFVITETGKNSFLIYEGFFKKEILIKQNNNIEFYKLKIINYNKKDNLEKYNIPLVFYIPQSASLSFNDIMGSAHDNDEAVSFSPGLYITNFSKYTFSNNELTGSYSSYTSTSFYSLAPYDDVMKLSPEYLPDCITDAAESLHREAVYSPIENEPEYPHEEEVEGTTTDGDKTIKYRLQKVEDLPTDVPEISLPSRYINSKIKVISESQINTFPTKREDVIKWGKATVSLAIPYVIQGALPHIVICTKDENSIPWSSLITGDEETAPTGNVTLKSGIYFLTKETYANNVLIERSYTHRLEKNSFYSKLDEEFMPESITKEIDNKVDKVEGKQLSTEDFTTAYKNKIDTLSDVNGEVSGFLTQLESKADKTELQKYATKDELNSKVDRTDLEEYLTSEDLANYVQNSALEGYVQDSELEGYAKKTELENTYAKKTDLGNYATTDSLNSYATKEELNKKADQSTLNDYVTQTSANETYVTKTELTDLTNTYATKTDLAKKADQTALNSKVDKVSGKELSSNDFTNEEKEKLDALAEKKVDLTISDPTNEGFVLGRTHWSQLAPVRLEGNVSEEDTVTASDESGISYIWKKHNTFNWIGWVDAVVDVTVSLNVSGVSLCTKETTRFITFKNTSVTDFYGLLDVEDYENQYLNGSTTSVYGKKCLPYALYFNSTTTFNPNDFFVIGDGTVFTPESLTFQKGLYLLTTSIPLAEGSAKGGVVEIAHITDPIRLSAQYLPDLVTSAVKTFYTTVYDTTTQKLRQGVLPDTAAASISQEDPFLKSQLDLKENKVSSSPKVTSFDAFGTIGSNFFLTEATAQLNEHSFIPNTLTGVISGKIQPFLEVSPNIPTVLISNCHVTEGTSLAWSNYNYMNMTIYDEKTNTLFNCAAYGITKDEQTDKAHLGDIMFSCPNALRPDTTYKFKLYLSSNGYTETPILS